MTDQELNERAAKLLGGTITALGWLNWNDDRHSIADWSPATKIEHAWIVQAEVERRGLLLKYVRYMHRNHFGIYSRTEQQWSWLATAPPRARTEAAVAVLSNMKGE